MVGFPNLVSVGCVIRGPVEEDIDQHLLLLVGYHRELSVFLGSVFLNNRVGISAVYELRLQH